MLDSKCSGQVDGTQALALHLVLAGLPCGKGGASAELAELNVSMSVGMFE